jgi:hypothetical protein
MEVNYSVTIEEYALRHYIKNFQKKYKGAWGITLRSVIAELERIDGLLKTDKADLISKEGDAKIVKTDFRVAGTKESAKTSGNRCIILVDEKQKTVKVLLIYSKTDLSGTNETAEWKSLVKKNYPEVKSILYS